MKRGMTPTPRFTDDPKSRLIFALDVPTVQKARELVALLCDHVGYFKVGPELFLAAGSSLFDWLPANQTMLDLKFHDIPETVERSFKQAIKLGVAMATLHVQQGETLRRVAQVAVGADTLPLCVTVLTSMTATDLRELWTGNAGMPDSVMMQRVVANRVLLATDCGLGGFVCSPQEIKLVRGCAENATLVVPGIRPAGADKGDQQRTGTPEQAIRDGATALVIGRPIRDAESPVAAAEAIRAEIATALGG